MSGPIFEEQAPECFGAFVCLDDCVVSCPRWQESMQESEELEDERDED